MSMFLKQIIKKKLKHISYEDILFYGEQYGFSIDEQSARELANYIQTHDLDPFDEAHRNAMFQTLAQITNQDTAQKAEQMLLEIVKTYGLEHLL